MKTIEKTLAEKSIPVVSIQPNFMTACNRFRRELRAQGDACVVVLEPGRVALGIFDKTGWRTLWRWLGEEACAVVESAAVQVRTPDGPVVARCGDWIVLSHSGSFHVAHASRACDA